MTRFIPRTAAALALGATLATAGYSASAAPVPQYDGRIKAAPAATASAFTNSASAEAATAVRLPYVGRHGLWKNTTPVKMRMYFRKCGPGKACKVYIVRKGEKAPKGVRWAKAQRGYEARAQWIRRTAVVDDKSWQYVGRIGRWWTGYKVGR